jgi:regulator of replication initiation timing
MVKVAFEVLDNFSITIGSKKNKEINIKKGQTFTQNTEKSYYPSIQSLIEHGKIRKIIASEQTSGNSISKEESKEIKTQKHWGLSLFSKDNTVDTQKETPMLERKNAESIIKEDHRIVKNEDITELNDSVSQEINERLNGLNNKMEGLNIKTPLNEMKDKIDTIKHLIETYPKSVTLKDLSDFAKLVENLINQQTQSTNKSLHQIKYDLDTSAKKTVTHFSTSLDQNSEKVYRLSNSLKTSFQNMDEKLNDIPKKFEHVLNEQLEDTVKRSTRSLRTSVEETKEAMESLQGKANVLDDLKNKLDKVNITTKLNPFDHEDDVVLELFDQGQEILQQLTLASRHYVAQRKSIKLLEEENTRLKQEREQIAEVTTKAVEQKVTTNVTHKLITSVAEAFANLDDVYTDEKLAGVHALLHKHGLVRSDDLIRGNQLQIDAENRSQLEAFIDFEFDEAGTYTIVQSQFLWKDRNESYRKAKAEKAVELVAVEENTGDIIQDESTTNDAVIENTGEDESESKDFEQDVVVQKQVSEVETNAHASQEVPDTDGGEAETESSRNIEETKESDTVSVK